MCFFALWPCELLGPLGLQSDRWWGNEQALGLLGSQNIFDRNAFLLRWFNQTFNFEFSFRSEERGAQGGPEPVWSDQSWAAMFTSSSSWWSSPSSSATMSTELTLLNGGFEMANLRKIGYSRRRRIGYTTSAAPRRLTPFCQNCEKFLEKTEMLWYFAWNFHLHCMLWHWVIKN